MRVLITSALFSMLCIAGETSVAKAWDPAEARPHRFRIALGFGINASDRNSSGYAAVSRATRGDQGILGTYTFEYDVAVLPWLRLGLAWAAAAPTTTRYGCLTQDRRISSTRSTRCTARLP